MKYVFVALALSFLLGCGLEVAEYEPQPHYKYHVVARSPNGWDGVNGVCDRYETERVKDILYIKLFDKDGEPIGELSCPSYYRVSMSLNPKRVTK